ncbi:hypothetical protein EYF80_053038 [Liparis tanakae]|uniref:Uncharacterized protein n=1 Tax=Liparis tanakae TaxID=230148 RepID=A0A4Z2F7G1_9TELE|nr:hypothetical protein EYF80_053038 [Liparis tanakae]
MVLSIQAIRSRTTAKKRNFSAVSSSCARRPSQASSRPRHASTTSRSFPWMASARPPAYWAWSRAAKRSHQGVSSSVSYLFSQSADVSLEGGVHSVERLGFAEVLAHVVGQLLLLVVDLSHQLLPVVKVPEETEEEQKKGGEGDKSWIITTLV